MVLSNRLRYTVQHMSTGLMFSAFSPIIRDWYDFAITISGPPDMDYPMAAVGHPPETNRRRPSKRRRGAGGQCSRTRVAVQTDYRRHRVLHFDRRAG